MADDYGQFYESAGQANHIDPALLRALVQTESGGDPNAVSPSGAVGPAQLLPSTAQALGVTDPKDPAQAINGAARLLDQNLKAYGNLDDALRAYHGGTDRANWGPKTEAYHAKVLKAYGAPAAVARPTDDELLNGIPSADSRPSDEQLLAGIPSAPESAASPAAAAAAPASPSATLAELGKFALSPAGYLVQHPAVGIGALQGGADVGHTFINAINAGNNALSGPVASNAVNALIPGAPVIRSMLGPVETAAGINPAQNVREVGQFGQQYGGNPLATVGRIAGQTALTAPVIAAAPELLEASLPAELSGVGMVTSPLRSMASALRGIPYVGTGVANALSGSAQGVGAAAMTSAANPSIPVGQQMEQGGGVGAVLGPLSPLVQKIGAGVSKMFGASGNKLTQAVAAHDAEKAGTAIPTPVANALLDYGVQPGALSPQAQASMQAEAAAQLAAKGGIDPTQLARKANMENLGLTPTGAMVTRDPIQWAAEREAAKEAGRGAPLMTTFQNNNEVLRQHLNDVASGTGGVTADAHDAGQSVINAAQAKLGEWQGDVSRAYQEVQQTLGERAAVTPTRLQADLAPLSDQTAGIPIVDAITRRLQRYGVVRDAESGQWEGQISAANAEELRKFIAQEATHDPNSQRIVRGLQQSLDNDVVDSTGSDAFGAARDQARNRFQEIESSKILGDIQSGKATPDQFLNRYVLSKNGATAQDLGTLQQSLTTGNSLQAQRGTQAWNDLRQQTAEWIAQKATNQNPSEGMVSYPQLRTALQTIGPQKLRIIFGEEGANRYQSLLSAAHDSSFQPGMSPVNTSNTSNSLLAKVGHKGADLLKHIPGMEYPGLIVGGAMKMAQKAAGEGAADNAVANALRGSAVPPADAARAAVPKAVNPLLGAATIGSAANAPNYLTQDQQ